MKPGHLPRPSGLTTELYETKLTVYKSHMPTEIENFFCAIATLSRRPQCGRFLLPRTCNGAQRPIELRAPNARLPRCCEDASDYSLEM